MKPADQEFWDEVQREAESGETVVVGTSLQRPGHTAVDWTPVSKKVPPNASPVLAWEADEQVPGCVIASYYFLTGKWMADGAGETDKITHWQPLPLPPV